MACWLFPKCQGLCGIIFILCFLHLLHLWSRFPHLFHRWGDGSLQRINTFLIVLLLSPQAQLTPGLKLSAFATCYTTLGKRLPKPQELREWSHIDQLKSGSMQNWPLCSSKEKYQSNHWKIRGCRKVTLSIQATIMKCCLCCLQNHNLQ